MRFKSLWPYLFITFVTAIFFYPVFLFGHIPFPGDLLVNQNPYKAQSYLGYAPGAYPNKAQGMDIITEIYPWRNFSFSAIKSGFFPFWNPYNFSGNPQMANFQTAVLYPINYIYLLLDFNSAWTVLTLLQPLLAGFFMIIFLSHILKLSKFSAAFGGVLFAFSTYMIVWLEYGNIGHTILWFPLILYLSSKLTEKVKAKYFIGLTLVLSLSLYAGYIQAFFYISVFTIIFCLYFFPFMIKNTLVLLSSFLAASLIGGAQILPTMELFRSSTRGSYSLDQIEKMLMPVYYWVTFFVSDFFGNPAKRNYWIDGTYIERAIYPSVAAAFFAGLSVFKILKKREVMFFFIASLVTFVLTTNLPFVKYFYKLPIPVISTTVPTRLSFVFLFSIICLAAFGLDYFLKNKLNKRAVFIFSGIYVSILFFELVFYNLGSISKEKIITTLRNTVPFLFFVVIFILGLLAYPKWKKVGIFIVFLITVIDLYFFFSKITPFSPSIFTYPKTDSVTFLRQNLGNYRYWSYGSAYIPPNFETFERIYSPEGNDPLHISSYGELLQAAKTGKLEGEIPRPDANIPPGYGDDFKHNKNREKILNLVGVKYIIHEFPGSSFDNLIFDDKKFKLVWQKGNLQIYENKNVLPRYFLTNSYSVQKFKDQAIEKIFKEDLGRSIILEKEPGIKIDPSFSGSVDLIYYSANRVEFNTFATSNSLLFLSDTFYPEWKAKIDSHDTEILKANYAFRAIAIPSGKHSVIFEYVPKSFYNGLYLTGLGIVLGIAVSVYLKLNEKS